MVSGLFTIRSSSFAACKQGARRLNSCRAPEPFSSTKSRRRERDQNWTQDAITASPRPTASMSNRTLDRNQAMSHDRSPFGGPLGKGADQTQPNMFG